MTDSDPLGETSPFSYHCTRCNSCCVGPRIQVNPYEIARIARNRGLSTTEAKQRFTTDGSLARPDGKTCVFLGDGGCSIHPDRPLVCRLFPLGRLSNADGSHNFFRLADGRWARGDFGVAGKVGDYIEAQGAAPFISAADAYFGWYLRATDANARFAPYDDDARDLLDQDSEIALHCNEAGTIEPTDIEDRLALHIAILDALLENGNGERP